VRAPQSGECRRADLADRGIDPEELQEFAGGSQRSR
jgi:hypothetical protein